MEKSGAELTYGPSHPFTRARGLQLLYDFYSLRFPELYRSSGLKQAGPLYNDLLNSHISPIEQYDRLTRIRATFMPVVSAVLPEADSVHPILLRAAVVDYCQSQFSLVDQARLHDLEGQIMTANEILPSEKVLSSMHSDWKDAEASSWCKELQRFIAQAALELGPNPLLSA